MKVSEPLGTLTVVTQYENVGDAWINRELIRLLAERMEVWVDSSRAPAHFARSMGLTEISRVHRQDGLPSLLLRQVRERLRRRKTYHFLSPGANFGELGVRRLFRGWLLTGLVLALRIMGVRVVIAGASYEHLGPHHRRLLSFRSRFLYAHLVRDRESADYARQAGIIVTGVIPDLSLATEQLVSPNTSDSRNTIAFSFRTDQDQVQLPQVREQLLNLARNLGTTVEWRPVIQVERDAEGMQLLTEALRLDAHNVANPVIVARDLPAAEQAYQGARHVLSNRLHALLLGASRSALPWAWLDPWHNVKITRIFRQLNVEDRVYSMGDLQSVAELAERIRQSNEAPLSFASSRQKLEQAFNELIGLPLE